MLAHRTRRVVALLACLAVLTGCDSNPSPAPLPSESPSPSSSSPSPTATPPTLPAAAKGTSEAAAKAFVRYWIDTLNYAGETGDTSGLRRVSSPECKSCVGIADKIDRVYEQAGYVRGDGWVIRSMAPVSGQSRARPILQIGMFLSEQDLLERAGGEVQHFDGGKQLMVFRLWNNDRWVVTEIEQNA